MNWRQRVSEFDEALWAPVDNALRPLVPPLRRIKATVDGLVDSLCEAAGKLGFWFLMTMAVIWFVTDIVPQILDTLARVFSAS